MGFLDSIFGNKNEEQLNQQPNSGVPQSVRPQNADEQAVARYKYMLQTAPPEDIEKAHAEAFAKLTPEQRKLALQQLSQDVPESEAAGLNDDPRTLARAATRAEMRQPGAMQRIFGGNQAGGNQMGGGMMGGGGGLMGGMGGAIAGSLLGSVAGTVIGSSIAHSFFSNPSNEQSFQQSPEAQSVDGGASDYNAADYQETGLDSSADPLGDPENGGVQEADTNAGLDQGADQGNFDNASYDDGGLDSGGFDSGFDGGGFDGGDFGGGDFGGDF